MKLKFLLPVLLFAGVATALYVSARGELAAGAAEPAVPAAPAPPLPPEDR